MKTKWLAIIPFAAFAVVACSDTQPPVTESAPQTTSETAAQLPQPTTPAETTTQQVEGINLTARYTRQNVSHYSSGYQPGQVSFSSADGTIECEFRPMEQDAPINREPSTDWRLSFAQGACQFDDGYVVADTNVENRPGFAEYTTAISHVMPENYTALPPGTYIDLHTMACFTETADEISCIKYATSETFRISVQGFEMLSNAQRDAELTTQGGLYQAFSSIAEIRFSDGNAMSCFFDAPGSQDFWCQTLSSPGWDDGNNLIHMTVTGGNIALMGTQVGNPGLDYFRGRQLMEAPNSLLDASLAVALDGDRVRFRTATGEEMWVSSSDYGLGV